MGWELLSGLEDKRLTRDIISSEPIDIKSMDVQYIDLLKYFYDNYNQTIYFEEYFPCLISEPPNLKECRSIDNQAQCNQNNKCLWQRPENSMHIVQIRFIIVIV